MNVLLINVPSRSGRGGKVLPLGLLYVGGIIERTSHSVNIVDPYNKDPELTSFDNGDYSEIDKTIIQFHPKIIGFGGIASSYGRTKKISEYIHRKYPDILQIAGGPLASVYDLLLTNTYVNLVFHGETENTFPQFLEKIEREEAWQGIDGTSYRNGDRIIRNPLSKPIENLDIVPIPPYHLVNLEEYSTSISSVLDTFATEINSNFNDEFTHKLNSFGGSLIPIITSRGCTNKCSFCYRHMNGYRQHSVSYVVDHIKFLHEHYGIKGFDFADELFNYNKQWVIDFCNALDQENLDIIYRILGARVDRIDKEMLQRLKDTGCIYIAYGQESGSDLILKEYKKGVTSQKNKEITILTTGCGLICPVQIVIGSPGETQKTINETINFLIEINAGTPSLNYLLPFPETPIWRYIQEKRLIVNVETYLDAVAEFGGGPIVNLTSVSQCKWKNWGAQIQYEVKLNNHRRNGQYFHYVVLFPVIKLLNFLRPYAPNVFLGWR